MTSWSPVPSGSVFRVPLYSYPNWGIKPTAENMEFLYANSCAAYMVEWQHTDTALNNLVAIASKNAQLGDVNTLMNVEVGNIGAEYLGAAVARNGGFTVVDIGSGAGATSLRLLASIQEIGIRPTRESTIYLIDPSEERMAYAKGVIIKALEGCGFSDIVQIVAKIGRDKPMLDELDEGSVSLAVSNAAIHHNAFNRHLDSIRRVLAPEGQFINGDWHEGMWESPSRTYWMLAVLRDLHNDNVTNSILAFVRDGTRPEGYTERKEVAEFRKYFGLSMNDVHSAFDGTLPSERLANTGIMKFWLSVGKTFNEKGSKAPIWFLEAHEPLARRIRHLEDAGLKVLRDPDGQPLLRQPLVLRGQGDLATVMRCEKPQRLKVA